MVTKDTLQVSTLTGAFCKIYMFCLCMNELALGLPQTSTFLLLPIISKNIKTGAKPPVLKSYTSYLLFLSNNYRIFYEVCTFPAFLNCHAKLSSEFLTIRECNLRVKMGRKAKHAQNVRLVQTIAN